MAATYRKEKLERFVKRLRDLASFHEEQEKKFTERYKQNENIHDWTMSEWNQGRKEGLIRAAELMISEFELGRVKDAILYIDKDTELFYD